MRDIVERLKELRLFLSGETPLSGLHFGERVGKASFWWRRNLSRLDEAASTIERLTAENERLRKELRRPDADRRQSFISELMASQGHINRRDIMDEFHVSMPQASADLKRWRASNVAEYNKSTKRYERPDP